MILVERKEEHPVIHLSPFLPWQGATVSIPLFTLSLTVDSFTFVSFCFRLCRLQSFVRFFVVSLVTISVLCIPPQPQNTTHPPPSSLLVLDQFKTAS